MKIYVFIASLLLHLPLISFNQTLKSVYNIPEDSLISYYNNLHYSKYDYIIGKEYKPYHILRQDKPYLNSSMGTGRIYSNGRTFKASIIMYDIFRDEVIVDLNDENFSKFYVQINKEKVDSFSIRFNDKIYNLSNVKNANGIEDGFYEIPHHGKLQLFIKHLVHKQNDHVMITYTYKQVLWLKRENHFYDISSKKKFIRQFPNHKKSVRRKIRLLKINFDFPNRLKLVKLLQHAESL